jgi:hypothetical protein
MTPRSGLLCGLQLIPEEVRKRVDDALWEARIDQR